jgi:hypothetical protein
MALVTVLLVLGSVAGTCYPLGYRLLVDGALAGDAATTAEGVAVVALLLGLGWVLTAIGSTEAMALSDRIAVYRTSRLIELISGVPGLEHLERPDYLAEVEQLNAGRRQLATAPRQILSNVSSAARIIALLVLLGSVSPWLLLLPVTAVPPLIADRAAKKITKRSEDEMSAQRRLAGMIFELLERGRGRRAPLLRPIRAPERAARAAGRVAGSARRGRGAAGARRPVGRLAVVRRRADGGDRVRRRPRVRRRAVAGHRADDRLAHPPLARAAGVGGVRLRCAGLDAGHGRPAAVARRPPRRLDDGGGHTPRSCEAELWDHRPRSFIRLSRVGTNRAYSPIALPPRGGDRRGGW